MPLQLTPFLRVHIVDAQHDAVFVVGVPDVLDLIDPHRILIADPERDIVGLVLLDALHDLLRAGLDQKAVPVLVHDEGVGQQAGADGVIRHAAPAGDGFGEDLADPVGRDAVFGHLHIGDAFKIAGQTVQHRALHHAPPALRRGDVDAVIADDDVISPRAIRDQLQLIDAVLAVEVHAAVHIADRTLREHPADIVDLYALEEVLPLGGDHQRVGKEHHLRRIVLGFVPAVDTVVERPAEARIRHGLVDEIDIRNAVEILRQAGDDRRLLVFLLPVPELFVLIHP